MLPTTNKPRLALVRPTFSLRLSARKPMCPRVLFRTVEKIITSFSRPSKPSTDLISMFASCIVRCSPSTRLNRSTFALFLLNSRSRSETCATYGVITPMSDPRRPLDGESARPPPRGMCQVYEPHCEGVGLRRYCRRYTLRSNSLCSGP